MGSFGAAAVDGVNTGRPLRGIALDIGSSRTRAWAPGAGVFADVPSVPVRRGRVTDTDSQLRLLRRLAASAPG
uniref:hypothetical protein n=1 Tax=Saccharothrix sp. NRRL B-16314 TaxID=1463825 RepID=UPI0005267385